MLKFFFKLFISFIVCFFSYVSSYAATTTEAPIVVFDDNNNRVELHNSVQSIVSLSPAITELLFSVGAGEKIVGTVSYSDFPEAAKKIAIIGAYQSLDLEKIIALKPELVIAWSSGNQSKQLEMLKSHGLTVYYSNPQTSDDIYQTLINFSLLTGNKKQGQLVAQDFIQKMSALKTANKDKKTVTVLVQIWDKPLMTVGRSHFISKVLEICSARNIFIDNQSTLNPSLESVLAKKPEMILSTGMTTQGKQWLEKWKKWDIIPAVANQQLYSIDPDILVRPSLRIAQGSKQVCELVDKVRNKNRVIENAK